MQHPSTSDDRLLAFEVETALKALGIAAGADKRIENDLRSAVEDLRAPDRQSPRLHRSADFTPALLADDEIFGLR